MPYNWPIIKFTKFIFWVVFSHIIDSVFCSINWCKNLFCFKDNDFTPLLENYTSKIFDIGYYNSINEYSEFKRKIYKYENDNLSEKEKQQLKKLIENQLIINCRKYISSHKKAEYLIKSLEIKIVETIEDKWQNNEVVYYITSNLKYLVM